MPLIVNDAAQATCDAIRHELRSARKEMGLYQSETAKLLSIGQTRLSTWESGAHEPSVNELAAWAQQFSRRLVILDHTGQPWPDLTRRLPGESLEHYRCRRLAAPLRLRRQARALTLGALGQQCGVTADTIRRWELTQRLPTPIALVVWAQQLGCRAALVPDETRRRA